MKITVPSLIASLSLLVGCTTLGNLINGPSAQQVLIQAAVELGTGTMIDALPAKVRATDATDIMTACKAVIAVDTNNTSTLADMQAAIAAAMAKTTLTPNQQTLVNSAIGASMQLVAGKISSGVLTGSETTAINTVLTWVSIGAQPYATPAAAARFAAKR
jgi:hypothetical protein